MGQSTPLTTPKEVSHFASPLCLVSDMPLCPARKSYSREQLLQLRNDDICYERVSAKNSTLLAEKQEMKKRTASQLQK